MTSETFPTRQYPYTRDSRQRAPMLAPLPPALHAMVVGLDAEPRLVADGELVQFDDPFGRLLRTGSFPQTARAILAELDQRKVLEATSVFVVGDGGQIAWSSETADVARSIRLAITRSTAASAQPDLMISTNHRLDDAGAFLQVLGWDEAHGRYHYYERRLGTWLWAGDSFHALSAPSRGRGPFDSHVNGALVMKELKAPWLHWHSQSARISDDVFPPTDPIRSDPMWSQRENAEVFETRVVRPGVHRWNQARFAASSVTGVLRDARTFFRQLVMTTTVNLVSSDVQGSQVVNARSMRLPWTFFADTDAFLNLLELDVDLEPVFIDGSTYAAELTAANMRISDGEGFERAGDTHFAFVVPERAFEDQVVVEELLRRGFLSPRLAACILAVDLANPVYSPTRASLLELFPDEVAIGGSTALDAIVIDRARQMAGSAPAAVELLDLWSQTEARGFAQVIGRQLVELFERVRTRARTPEGVRDYLLLADGRRRRFRRSMLAEFRLTVPVSDLPATTEQLSLKSDGTIT